MNSFTNKKAPKRSNNHQRWPGLTYWIILFTTTVLLIATTVSFFIVLLVGGGNKATEGGFNIGGNENNEVGNGTGGAAVNVNTTPLYPTTPSRSNYISTTASDVASVGDAIQSNNTILVSLDNYTSVAEKNADAKIYPASMTKVMTLLVACENISSLDTMLTINEKHLNYLSSSGGGSSFLANDPDLVGERISVKDALYLISYESDTIACLLIADHISGSEEAFVELMNKKAQQLNLAGTHFTNSTGLYNDEHYSTCRDIAAIMAYAMENELAKKILLSTEKYSFQSDKFYTASDSTKKVTYYPNYPSWLDQRFGQYSSAGVFQPKNELSTVTVVAGKTGYIDEAGVCLVSYAVSKTTGKGYINVIVGQPKGSGLGETQSTDEVKLIYNTYVE